MGTTRAPAPAIPDIQRVLNPPWSRWVVRGLRPAFVLAFCGLVPFVWSLATGYTFDWRALTFETTAVLALDTTPPGAAIELNGRLLDAVTPATLERLTPGRYRVRLALPGHYGWSRTVTLDGGAALSFSTILLMPRNPRLTQLLDEAVTDFWMDADGTISVRPAGEPREVKTLRGWAAEARLTNPLAGALQGTSHDKVSPDGTALLRWDADHVWLMPYNKSPWDTWGMVGEEVVLYREPGGVRNAFWHQDSRNVVVVSAHHVAIIALEHGTVERPVFVHRLLDPLPLSYYQAHRGWLYVADAASGWKAQEWFVERLELFAAEPAAEAHDEGADD